MFRQMCGLDPVKQKLPEGLKGQPVPITPAARPWFAVGQVFMAGKNEQRDT